MSLACLSGKIENVISLQSLHILIWGDFMFACIVNIKRDIKCVNRFVFFIYLLFCLTVMSVAHIMGGRSYLYNCLRTPLFAPNRACYIFIVVFLCILISLALALYVNRFKGSGIFWKFKANLLFLFFVILCGMWYPTFFSLRRFTSALIILLLLMIIGMICVKVFSKKCLSASLVMLGAEIIIIYLFFLQLCINILN